MSGMPKRIKTVYGKPNSPRFRVHDLVYVRHLTAFGFRTVEPGVITEVISCRLPDGTVYHNYWAQLKGWEPQETWAHERDIAPREYWEGRT